MKKRIMLALSMLCLLALVVALASCGHEHTAGSDWKSDDANHWNECTGGCGEKQNSAAHTFTDSTEEATCTEKGQLTQTCTVCGYVKTTEIETAAHDYADATCTAPKTCKTCGATEGEANGHNGGEATCTELAVCETCSEPYGELVAHDYADATCTAPKTCKACGATEGEANGHNGGTATCTELAVCETCGEAYGETLPHQGGTATCTAKAVCDVCSQEYGELAFHTVANGVCTVCEAVLRVVEAEGVEKIEASHTTGGAANTDKLFDGEKNTTGIYTVGDKEYSPNAVGDTLTIILKNEVYVSEIAVWQAGNWSTAEVQFCDADGKVVFRTNMAFDNIAEAGAESKAKYINLGTTYKIKSIKFVCTELKWNSGKTEKISEIEIFVSGCTEHVYVDANCAEAKHCAYCGVSEGEALGHKGGKVTCTDKAVCEVCGESYGEEPAGHKGGTATCTDQATCEVCNTPYGEPLGHKGGTATCTAKAVCEVCELEYGDYNHQGGTATCTAKAVCELCGVAYGAEPVGHQGGEATCEAKAVCTACGAEYGDYAHQGGFATCTTKAVCAACGKEYGEYSHTYNSENKSCSTCGATFVALGADAIDSVTASHEGGGSANVDKLFDGEKLTTSIYGSQDKEYFPKAHGDYITIVLKEETCLNEAIIWTLGNYTYADVEFYDEDGILLYTKTIIYNAEDKAGDSTPVKIALNGLNVKTVKLIAKSFKWGDGRTQKTSEIELISNATVAAE